MHSCHPAFSPYLPTFLRLPSCCMQPLLYKFLVDSLPSRPAPFPHSQLSSAFVFPFLLQPLLYKFLAESLPHDAHERCTDAAYVSVGASLASLASWALLPAPLGLMRAAGFREKRWYP